MNLSARSRLLTDYGFAIVSVALAFVITLLIPALFGASPSLLFFAAVTLSAWYGGFGPGIIASLISLIIVRQFFLPTAGLLLLNPADLTRLLAFIVVTGVVGALHLQRQRTLDALRRSRDQLDIYLRDMANGIMVQDPTGKLIYANYEAAKLMGFVSGEALIQGSADSVLEPYEIFDEFGEPLPASSLPGRLALLGMQYPETVLRVRFKESGKERWAYDKARPVFDEHGHVQSAISLFLDITDLKHAQQSLAEQQEQLRVTLRSIGDAVIATDAEGKVTFVNPLAATMTGWNESSALAKPISEVVHLVHEGTGERVENPFGRVQQEGIPVRLADHLALVAKDNAERPIEVTGAPIRDEQNHLIGTVMVFRDITERRIAESLLQARIHQQEVVATLGLRALTTIDLQSLMHEAAEQLAETLQIEYVEILRVQPDEKTLLLQAGIGWMEGRVGHTTVDAGKNSHGGFTLVANEPVILEDMRAETRFTVSPLLREHNVISGMSVIITGGGNPWGVLGVHTIKKRAFTKDDIHFLQAVANLLASTIERDRVQQAERDQRIFAEALRDTAEALNRSLDLGQVLDRMLENVERVVPHDAADIMLIEGDNAHVVRYRGYNEYNVNTSLLELRFPLTTASLQQVISTGKPLIISDTRTFPGWVKVPGMEWLLSYLAVPLLIQGQVKGFLNVSSVTPNFFTEAQANGLESFAAQASVAIRNAQVYDQARKTSENKAVL